MGADVDGGLLGGGDEVDYGDLSGGRAECETFFEEVGLGLGKSD